MAPLRGTHYAFLYLHVRTIVGAPGFAPYRGSTPIGYVAHFARDVCSIGLRIQDASAPHLLRPLVRD